jgi:hypothetical protein
MGPIPDEGVACAKARLRANEVESAAAPETKARRWSGSMGFLLVEASRAIRSLGLCRRAGRQPREGGAGGLE